MRGIKVIDAGTMIAGPLVATLLADFGANVIKIEEPGVGDPMRSWAPHKRGVSLWWKVTGRNKRLATANLRSAAGVDVVRRLAKGADVLVENYRPGTFARWGLGDEVLLGDNPRLIIVHVSGYGQTGPYRDKPGYGTVAEAFSGIPSFTGFPDGPPQLSAFPLADSVAAVFGAMAVGFALHHRSLTDQGQAIDVSLYEPLFRLVESQVIGFDQLGLIKRRRGNRLEEDSPRNAYETRDHEWVTLSASSQRTFERLAIAIGHPDLLTDQRYLTNQDRVENSTSLDDVLLAWFGAHDYATVAKVLDKYSVVYGPVLDIREIFEDPQYLHRNDIITVQDEDLGTVRMQSVVPLFSATPGRVWRSGGNLGEDTSEVLRELGFSEPEVTALRNEGSV